MKFKELEPRNFLTLGTVPVLHLADRGLVLIEGVNEDDSSTNSNGAGKSSIADALCWALFGVTARGEKGDAVVNNKLKKECFVRLRWSDGDTDYEVIRHRKHKEHKNATHLFQIDADGTRTPLHKGTEAETQVVIEEKLGCSYEVFTAAIYAGQECMPDIPAMTDKQLKLLVEEASGTERLERAYEIAGDRLKKQEEARGIVRIKLERAQAAVEAAQARVEQSTASAGDHDAGRGMRAEHFRSQAGQFKDYVAQVTEHVRGLQASADAENIAEVEAVLASHRELLAQAQALAEESMGCRRLADKAGFDTDVQLKEVERLKASLDNAEAEMAKPCPECGKPHTPEELESFKAHLTERLRAAAISARACMDASNTAKATLEQATTREQQFRAGMPDVSAMIGRQQQHARLIAEINRLSAEAKVSQGHYDNLTARADQELTQPNPFHAVLEQDNQALANARAALAGVESEFAAAEHAVTLAQTVVKVFSPAGVRAQILDTVTPFLNERTSEYLSTLSDGNINVVWSTLSTTARGELREKFVIEVENEHGATSFGGLSGGEKKKVRLACMLALQDLVASRATKPIDLWVGDEVDGALDAAGLERLMVILEKRARDRGTVLVISHNDLKCWINDVTTVTKTGKTSTVSGILTETRHAA
ncbi:AAA family ATPase [Cupriavidus metallidurans]|uniref:AAA family ATPase n=1 Tax=Cupriavidus metallidurans TaxID=119219 RepID=UPI001CCE3A95|nr:SMC family ATPase [Cupriavidus metallidurans]UBM12711.1 SMC family ATPase [Cupriavidus metallidurans]